MDIYIPRRFFPVWFPVEPLVKYGTDPPASGPLTHTHYTHHQPTAGSSLPFTAQDQMVTGRYALYETLQLDITTIRVKIFKLLTGLQVEVTHGIIRHDDRDVFGYENVFPLTTLPLQIFIQTSIFLIPKSL